MKNNNESDKEIENDIMKKLSELAECYVSYSDLYNLLENKNNSVTIESLLDAINQLYNGKKQYTNQLTSEIRNKILTIQSLNIRKKLNALLESERKQKDKSVIVSDVHRGLEQYYKELKCYYEDNVKHYIKT